MSLHLPALIIVVPFLSALIIAIVMWKAKRYCFPIAAIALGLTTIIAVRLLQRVLVEGEVLYNLAGWHPPIGISYRVDLLNGVILVIIAFVAFFHLISSRKNVQQEFPRKIGPFYSLYLLFLTGLLGIVITGDAFNLYVLLEICSLSGYALIGLGQDRAPLSSLHYLFMGTIGASFYLLGIGYLYIMTGSLNMVDLASLLPNIYNSTIVFFAFLFCLVGLFIKMAFFPLHGWLPNAYSYSPSPSTGIIAALTTKVMVYVMIRIGLTVYTPSYIFETINLGSLLVWLATLAIILASLFALAQKRLKRMLSYIIVAEVGYMVGGFWLGNRSGISGAMLHIVNDAVMTLCLFMAVGIIDYKLKDDRIEKLKGLFRKMPFTMAAFVVGGLSIIGIPPTCGFFSKWYLISGGIEAGHYGYVVALLFSSLINAVLFFRIFEICYYEPIRESEGGHHHGPADVAYNEAPLGMVLPLLIVAGSLIILGFLSGTIVTGFVDYVIPVSIL